MKLIEKTFKANNANDIQNIVKNRNDLPSLKDAKSKIQRYQMLLNKGFIPDDGHCGAGVVVILYLKQQSNKKKKIDYYWYFNQIKQMRVQLASYISNYLVTNNIRRRDQIYNEFIFEILSGREVFGNDGRLNFGLVNDYFDTLCNVSQSILWLSSEEVGLLLQINHIKNISFLAVDNQSLHSINNVADTIYYQGTGRHFSLSAKDPAFSHQQQPTNINVNVNDKALDNNNQKDPHAHKHADKFTKLLQAGYVCDLKNSALISVALISLKRLEGDDAYQSIDYKWALEQVFHLRKKLANAIRVALNPNKVQTEYDIKDNDLLNILKQRLLIGKNKTLNASAIQSYLNKMLSKTKLLPIISEELIYLLKLCQLNNVMLVDYASGDTINNANKKCDIIYCYQIFFSINKNDTYFQIALTKPLDNIIHQLEKVKKQFGHSKNKANQHHNFARLSGEEREIFHPINYESEFSLIDAIAKYFSNEKDAVFIMLDITIRMERFLFIFSSGMHGVDAQKIFNKKSQKICQQFKDKRIVFFPLQNQEMSAIISSCELNKKNRPKCAEVPMWYVILVLAAAKADFYIHGYRSFYNSKSSSIFSHACRFCAGGKNKLIDLIDYIYNSNLSSKQSCLGGALNDMLNIYGSNQLFSNLFTVKNNSLLAINNRRFFQHSQQPVNIFNKGKFHNFCYDIVLSSIPNLVYKQSMFSGIKNRKDFYH